MHMWLLCMLEKDLLDSFQRLPEPTYSIQVVRRFTLNVVGHIAIQHLCFVTCALYLRLEIL